MTDTQLQFCRDVAEAMRVYQAYHPTYELSDEHDDAQKVLASEYHSDQRLAADTSDDRVRERLESEAKFSYYRKMNYLLREISGAAVPEPIGTGNFKADYDRAMAVVDK